jgi:hypothetical protein
MASDRIFLVSEFDATKINVGEVKALDSGAKICNVTVDGVPIKIQLPEMHVPFPYKEYLPKEGGGAKYTLTVSFSGRDSNPKIKKLYEQMEKMDNTLKGIAHERSFEWFGGKKSMELIEDKFRSTVRWSIDKDTKLPTEKYPPMMSFKMPFDAGNDKFTFDMFDYSGKPIDIRNVNNKAKDSKVHCIIACTGIWLSGGMFGCSWKLDSIVVKPAMKVSGFRAFRFDPEDQMDKREMIGGSDDAPDRNDNYCGEESQDVTHLVSDDETKQSMSTSIPDEDEEDDSTVRSVKKRVPPK